MISPTTEWMNANQDDKFERGSRDSIKSRTVKQRQQELLGRRSVATSVFLEKNQSIACRLGRHVAAARRQKRHSSEDSERERIQRRKEAKKEECRKFCCNRQEGTCLGKNAIDWIGCIVLLFFSWAILFFLIWVFFQIFVAIEGQGPDPSGSSFEREQPKLVDMSVVKSNIDKGYSGKSKVAFPFRYGDVYFFPGMEPLTFSIWENEKKYPDKNKRSAYDHYHSLFTTITGMTYQNYKNGSVDARWAHDYEEAYRDFFKTHYNTPNNTTPLCKVDPDQFRPYGKDWRKAGCDWPNSPDITADSLDAYYCNGPNETRCMPFIYFTFNMVYGWMPSKTNVNDKVGVFCKVDEEDRRNKASGHKKDDFQGEVVNSTDFGNVSSQRFPFLHQKNYKLPMIRYKVTKMPGSDGKKADFVITCRLDYPAFHKQNEVDAPFNVRTQSRYWTKMRIIVNVASSLRQISKTLLFSCVALFGVLIRAHLFL